MPEEATDIAGRLDAVRARIAAACGRAGRDPAGVEIVAVTKTFGPDVVRDAWQAGLRRFGENRVQEAAVKIPVCGSGPEWHLVGHLQRNKVRPALEIFPVIHAVDSARLLEHIARVAGEIGCQPTVLLEINVSGEASKFGLRPEAAPEAIERALELRAVTLSGLMTMAPFSPDPERTRPVFSRLRTLRDEWSARFGIGLPHLSMGMSGDFEVAVEEGATWVRLGTVLFGHRRPWAALRGADGAEEDGP
jgi:pyridoxal phosphate enzyme (YggS family)